MERKLSLKNNYDISDNNYFFLCYMIYEGDCNRRYND